MYGFNPSIKELTVADKVVRYSKEKKQFEISVNKKYFLDWTIVLFIIAVLLFATISLPLMFWSMIIGCITLIIPLLFVLAGVRFYYLASNNDQKIIIDNK
jgi:ABC-type spermidine/putrescine transport system permease subunit II